MVELYLERLFPEQGSQCVLNVKLTTATVVCSLLGCVLTVGLAFSSKVRCVVLLTVPQFFSKRGRQALLAYAFALALTGPAQNTLNNMGILSESLACGQEQLKQAVKQIIDVIKKPFVAIKEAIKKVIKTVKEVVKKIKEILLKIKRIIMAIVRVIKSVFEFLGKIMNICNKELGTPFERCTRVFENAIVDCNAKLGPLFNWLCSIAYIVKAVCYIVKVFDYVCMLVDFLSDSVVGVIIRKVKTFVRHIKTMFYVRIKFSHSFEFQTTASKSITEIAKAIVAEIKDRSKGLVAFFNFMTSAVLLFFLNLIFQVVFYRIRFLTSEKFNNIYITKYFRQIDLQRAKLGKETVLPLNKKEGQIYVPISSGKLAKVERKSLSKAAVTLATATVKLGTHMIADYCLYWILNMIQYHGRYQSKIQAPNLPVAHISGEGFIATLLRAIVNAFQPVGIKLEIDTVPCLPIPIPPDFDRYVQIGTTLLICWILTILEPYGLRFRNYIMGYYHPVRAKQRTIWLYNHILRSRSSFLLFARRQLRRKFGDMRVEQVSCKDHIRAKLSCGIFRICLGDGLQMACLLCGDVFRENDMKKFVKCHTPGCPGLFCQECFADLKNICPICLSPIEYGDLDNLDEEKDSSGDEQPKKPKKKKKKCPCLPCGKPDDDDKELLLPKDDEEHDEADKKTIDEPEEGDKQGKQEEDKEEEEKEEEEKTKDEKEKQMEVCEESDTSTDLSYTYQHDEEQQPYKKPVSFKDVEKQSIPDYASMSSFQDEEEYIWIDFDNKIKVPKGHAALVKLDVSACVSDDEEVASVELVKDEDKKEPSLKDTDLLIGSDLSEKTSPRKVEFIGVPNTAQDVHKTIKRKVKIIPSNPLCCCSELELLEHMENTSLITLPKSTISTSTRSDCQYCKCPEQQIHTNMKTGMGNKKPNIIVPKLDLSFLDLDNLCTCDNPILSHRFRHVAYDEISETPPSSLSKRSLESSSVISSLENSPIVETEPTVLRKRKIGTQYKSTIDGSSSFSNQKKRNNVKKKTKAEQIDASSLSSMDSYEFNKAYNQKVRQYYKKANNIQMCEKGCQYPKKRSIGTMFRRLIPKRKSKHEYLPLHRFNIDDRVEGGSYNNSQNNWDTLSLNTDSPTYPFGVHSDSTDEDEHLLGDRRIRGGECTHFINCKFFGKTCPDTKKRVFDAKSRTYLKDFSTLSLPPKPKPANTKELLNRLFNQIKIKPPYQIVGLSMKPLENKPNERTEQSLDKSSNKECSTYIVNKSTTSFLTLREDATPPSSDSGLSENTCLALFGGSCPRGLGKQSCQDRLSVSSEDINSHMITSTKEKSIEKEIAATLIEKPSSSKREESLINTLNQVYNSKESVGQRYLKKEKGLPKKEISKSNELSDKTENILLQGISNLSLINKTERNNSGNSQKNQSINQINLESQQPSKKVESCQSGIENQLQTEQVLSASSGTQKEIESIHSIDSKAELTFPVHPPKPETKKGSAQLNQLLYKDDKTEISLVQRLSPDKSVVRPYLPIKNTQLSIRPVPNVKLQISLHNSIIPDEEKTSQTDIEMKSPKSKDKIVETKETFPLRPDWVTSDSSGSGKLILASDKIQQTSNNNLYRSSDNSLNTSSQIKTSVRQSLTAESSTSFPTHQNYSQALDENTPTNAYYSNQPAERESNYQNCRCPACGQKQVVSVPQDVSLLSSQRELTQTTHTSATSTNKQYSCCCRCDKKEINDSVYAKTPFIKPSPPPFDRVSPVRSYNRKYPENTFLLGVSNRESSKMLPPPPPRFTYPFRASGRHRAPQQTSMFYGSQCCQGCNCNFRNGQPDPVRYAGDYDQPSTSNTYFENRDTLDYGFQEHFNEDYYEAYDDAQYDNSKQNRNLDLMDLPYQNNEEYLELVEELQDTLHTRNRNRVKRAMQEFENKSKLNEPLEKPIINYDETSDSEEPIIRKIDQFRTDKKLCCAGEKCGCINRSKPFRYSNLNSRNEPFIADRLETSERPSHWTMDPSSGEWSKAYRHRRPKGPKGHEEANQCSCNCDRSRFQ